MMRKPLGRGLGGLIENTAFESSSPKSNTVRENSSITMAPVERISAGQFQPRQHFDAERLSELTRAIQSQGIIEPLIVRIVGNPDDFEGPRYELIAGERRLRAARAAGLETVPAIVRDLDDREALEMSLVENIVREDLNAVEEGLAFFRLVDHFGLTHDEIAMRVGKSRPYVGNSIRLLELPQAILNMIAKGELTAGQARPLLSIGSTEAQLSAARRIAAVGISSRGAEEMATANRPRNKNNAASRSSGGDAN